MQKQMQEATQNTTQNMGGVFSLLKWILAQFHQKYKQNTIDKLNSFKPA
jgi:hypothetical protein